MLVKAISEPVEARRSAAPVIAMSDQRHQAESRPTRTGAGPFGLGYLRLDPGASEPATLIAEGIAVMEETAGRCGYTVADVFIDDQPRRHLGWGSLMDAARVLRPVAVLIPDLAGLRLSDTAVDILRARLRYVTTAPLVLASPTLTPTLSTSPFAAPESSVAPEPTPELPARPRGTAGVTAWRARHSKRWSPWRR